MSGTKKGARARLQGGLISRFRQYLRGHRGAVAPILALSLVPIIGAMGMGAESASWWLTQRSLQNAADSAAMAGAINAGTADNGAGSAPAALTSTQCADTGSNNAGNWSCEAFATAAKMGYTDGSGNVTVTPVKLATGCPVSGHQCYQVSITKKVPIYLLSVLGFTGNTTIGTQNAVTVGANAIADEPGPPVNFCMLTTNGDFQTNGGHSADLLKCSSFANGNSNCNGQSDGLYADYATGTASCPKGVVNVPTQTAQCDPYGFATQTIQGTSTTCTGALDVSDSVPTYSNCGGSVAQNTAVNGTSGTMQFPTANVITQSMISALGAGNTTIQVCGNAAFGTAVTNTASTKNGKTTYTPSVTSCSSAINYTGSANITVVIYNGELDLNSCVFENTGTGGMTIIFAPPTHTATAADSTTCPNACVPTGSGTVDIAAPSSGSFKGLAIVQSGYYSESSGACSGSGNKAGVLDWCGAGNTPSIGLQGALYMPNGNIGFSGAISKFTASNVGGLGPLNCIGIVSESMYVNGTGSLFNNFTAGLTADCTAAGLTLPHIQGTHTYYQALVG